MQSAKHHENYVLLKKRIWPGQGRPWLFRKMAELSRSTKIVTIDVPDPDNFLMVLRVLKDNPTEQIDIVLSPRPVDFSAAAYPGDLMEMRKRVDQQVPEPDFFESLRRVMSPIIETEDRPKPAWIGALDESLQAWFYTDADFSSADVRYDTSLYMKVSALRLMLYLNAHEIDPNQYKLYRYDGATATIKAGFHHAAHRADWAWGLDDEDKADFDKAVKKAQDEGKPLSKDLRDTTHAILKKYVHATSKQLGLRRLKFERFEDLIAYNKKSVVPDIYVGGPFTEANAYASAAPVGKVIGMGGFLNGKTNLFANQFNFLVDMQSAADILKKANSGEVKLTLVPTECIKGSPYDIDSLDQLKAIIGKASPATIQLYTQWGMSKCTLFDLLVAIYIKVPELYRTRKVKAVIRNGCITFEESSSGQIDICWPDEDKDEYMRDHVALFHKELAETFVSDPKSGETLVRANSSL